MFRKDESIHTKKIRQKIDMSILSVTDHSEEGKKRDEKAKRLHIYIILSQISQIQTYNTYCMTLLI